MRQDQVLLNVIKANMPTLEKLLADCSGHWGYEDDIYRFYHHSFKVYYIQGMTKEIVNVFQWINTFVFLELDLKAPPDDAKSWDKWVFERRTQLNEMFMQIVNEGTGKKFQMEHNEEWMKHTRPMVEAFFHAKYMLEMMVKYGKELETAVNMLPSGWASVLYLYNMR